MLIDGLEGHEGSVLYPPVARCARCARTAAVAVGGFMRWSQRMVERCAQEAAITRRGAPCTRSLFFVAPRHVSDLGGPYSTQGDAGLAFERQRHGEKG